MPLCVKYRQNIRRKKLCITDYFGRQPSYMMLYLPYTCPQLRMCIDHFFVASKVELSIAIYRLGTIALVVWMTFLIAVENLKIEEIASQFCIQFCIQIFIELRYFLHFFSHPYWRFLSLFYAHVNSMSYFMIM